jgi:hypothetical protein
MDWKTPPLQPPLHRPESPNDLVVPHPVVADATGEQAEMRITILRGDKLAELAGMDPAALERTITQERGHLTPTIQEMSGLVPDFTEGKTLKKYLDSIEEE